jgi:hypothetical protein
MLLEISPRLMLRCRRTLFHRPPLLLHDGGGRGGGNVDHGSPYFSHGQKNPISVASRPSSPPPRPSIPIIPRTKKLEVQFLSSNSSELAERIPLRARAPSPNVHPKACDACVAGGGLGGGQRRCEGAEERDTMATTTTTTTTLPLPQTERTASACAVEP